MADKKQEYHAPGEHIHKGRRFPGLFPRSSLDKIAASTFDDSDVFLVGYPKSGTTWLHNICWMVFHETLDSLANTPIEEQNHFTAEYGESIDYLLAQSPPRFMRTHLPEDFYRSTLTTKKTKFIVIMRNVKDLLVSFYNFHKNHKQLDFRGTWSEFLDLFHAKHLPYGDYFEYNLGWWKYRDSPNILILKYEDMLENPEKGTAQIAAFMGKNLSRERIQKIAVANSFTNMQKDAGGAWTEERHQIKASDFFRKGKIGDWKEQFSPAESKALDTLIDEKLQGTGLELRYE